MQIFLTKNDLLAYTTYLSKYSSGFSVYHDVIKNGVSINNLVGINTNTKIGTIKLTILVLASGGQLKLNIKSVSLNGISIGFLVRGVVSNFIIKKLSSTSFATAQRSVDGNILWNVYSIYFNTIDIEGEVVSVDFRKSKLI
jgi:hypothetical protein